MSGGAAPEGARRGGAGAQAVDSQRRSLLRSHTQVGMKTCTLETSRSSMHTSTIATRDVLSTTERNPPDWNVAVTRYNNTSAPGRTQSVTSSSHRIWKTSHLPIRPLSKIQLASPFCVLESGDQHTPSLNWPERTCPIPSSPRSPAHLRLSALRRRVHARRSERGPRVLLDGGGGRGPRVPVHRGRQRGREVTLRCLWRGLGSRP